MRLIAGFYAISLIYLELNSGQCSKHTGQFVFGKGIDLYLILQHFL